ncbi:uncharacterized protein BX663DRAFT_267690 [Cokeromyces recurvatus]|uniref:uncharacterized protein n=1 Tax=Cokeromyces recurvatus TaxID=90255 RepID=UPI002220CFBF|nr:uncharacterized protein BX663DRAFT_267690 [Cokeromyces recurvatus]KAI7898121.1 hypothetical protein BX663DRAFT_267690 [Cokeromyces recurvatus]
MTKPSYFNQEQKPTLPSIIDILSCNNEQSKYDCLLYESAYKDLQHESNNKRRISCLDSSSFIKEKSEILINNDRTKRKQAEQQKRKKRLVKQNKCHSCQSTETPEWRKGPLGPRTLCNACGLIWTKLCKQSSIEENKKLTSAVTTTSASTSTSTSHNNNNNNKYKLSFLLT